MPLCEQRQKKKKKVASPGELLQTYWQSAGLTQDSKLEKLHFATIILYLISGKSFPTNANIPWVRKFEEEQDVYTVSK